MCACACVFGGGDYVCLSTHLRTHIFFRFFLDLQTLREFPEELRGDVSMHLHREILQLPIFEAASQVSFSLH